MAAPVYDHSRAGGRAETRGFLHYPSPRSLASQSSYTDELQVQRETLPPRPPPKKKLVEEDFWSLYYTYPLTQTHTCTYSIQNCLDSESLFGLVLFGHKVSVCSPGSPTMCYVV